MHFVASITAYDCLETVVISARVLNYDAQRETPEHEFTCGTAVLGAGEGDGRKWLRDALVALAETL